MTNVLAIDPGLTNLGWMLYNSVLDRVCAAGVENLLLGDGGNQKDDVSFLKSVHRWIQDHWDYLMRADVVLVEQQFQPKGCAHFVSRRLCEFVAVIYVVCFPRVHVMNARVTALSMNIPTGPRVLKKQATVAFLEKRLNSSRVDPALCYLCFFLLPASKWEHIADCWLMISNHVAIQ